MTLADDRETPIAVSRIDTARVHRVGRATCITSEREREREREREIWKKKRKKKEEADGRNTQIRF